MRKLNRGDMVRNEEECCEINGRLNLPGTVEAELKKTGGLDSLMDSLPRIEQLAARSSVHQALSDPVRLLILHALARCDLCPCLLKEITRQSDSKLSYHLNVLESAGLIESYPQKKWRIYVLTAQGRPLVQEGA